MYSYGRDADALAELDQTHLEKNDETGLVHKPLDYAKVLELRAEIAASQGQVEKSLEYFGQHLNLCRETHGQYSLELGLTLERMSVLLESVGRDRQAKEYRAWARRLYKTVYDNF